MISWYPTACIVLAYMSVSCYAASDQDRSREPPPHFYDEKGVYRGPVRCPIPPSDSPKTLNILCHGRHKSGRKAMIESIVTDAYTEFPTNLKVGHCNLYTDVLAPNVMFNFIDSTGFRPDSCCRNEQRLKSLDKAVDHLFQISGSDEVVIHRLYYILDNTWDPTALNIADNLKALQYVYGWPLVRDVVFVVQKCDLYAPGVIHYLRDICQMAYLALYGYTGQLPRVLLADSFSGMYQVWADLAGIAANPKPHVLCRDQIGSFTQELDKIKTEIYDLDFFLKYERDSMIEEKRRHLQQARDNIVRLTRFSQSLDAALLSQEPLCNMNVFVAAPGSVRIDGVIMDSKPSKKGIILAPGNVLANNPNHNEALKEEFVVIERKAPLTLKEYINSLNRFINPQRVPERHLQNYKRACMVEEIQALKNIVTVWVEANHRLVEECQSFLTSEEQGVSLKKFTESKSKLKEILMLAGNMDPDEEMRFDSMLHFPNCQCHMCLVSASAFF